METTKRTIIAVPGNGPVELTYTPQTLKALAGILLEIRRRAAATTQPTAQSRTRRRDCAAGCDGGLTSHPPAPSFQTGHRSGRRVAGLWGSKVLLY